MKIGEKSLKIRANKMGKTVFEHPFEKYRIQKISSFFHIMILKNTFFLFHRNHSQPIHWPDKIQEETWTIIIIDHHPSNKVCKLPINTQSSINVSRYSVIYTFMSNPLTADEYIGLLIGRVCRRVTRLPQEKSWKTARNL